MSLVSYDGSEVLQTCWILLAVACLFVALLNNPIGRKLQLVVQTNAHKRFSILLLTMYVFRYNLMCNQEKDQEDGAIKNNCTESVFHWNQNHRGVS